MVELRIDTFIKEFDIQISNVDFSLGRNTKKINWETLKQKFIKCNLVINNCTLLDCYLVIKNIVWKNIINYDVTDNKFTIYMYHNNFQDIRILAQNKSIYPFSILPNNFSYYYSETKDNCIKVQSKIINYISYLIFLLPNI